jgi:hypothetical protein
MRFLTGLVLAGLLAACNVGATTPSENPLPTAGSGAASASADHSAMAMGCEDAFAAIDVEAIAATGSLDALTNELDDTISSCSTVEEWSAAAQSALPAIDMTGAETFLQARCAESAALAATAICKEVGS